MVVTVVIAATMMMSMVTTVKLLFFGNLAAPDLRQGCLCERPPAHADHQTTVPVVVVMMMMMMMMMMVRGSDGGEKRCSIKQLLSIWRRHGEAASSNAGCPAGELLSA